MTATLILRARLAVLASLEIPQTGHHRSLRCVSTGVHRVAGPRLTAPPRVPAP